MEKEKKGSTVKNFNEQAAKWNLMREQNPGYRYQSDWSKLAAEYGCTHVNIVGKALKTSPFWEARMDGSSVMYSFTGKPVTRIFIEDVIKKHRENVRKVSPGKKNKKVVVVNEVRGHTEGKYEIHIGEKESKRTAIITRDQLEVINMFAHTRKDAELNTIYGLNECEFTIMPHVSFGNNEEGVWEL